jgi:hypothetical protein
MRLFMAFPMTLSAAIFDFGGRRYCRFGLNYFRQLQGLLIKICEVSMDAPFHGRSNDIIGGRVRLRRPEISLSSHGSILVPVTLFTVLQNEEISVITTVYTGQKSPKSLKFIAGVNNTAKKLFTGVNNTAHKFFFGVLCCQYQLADT